MKDPRKDDERLSALLEGRVEGRQREELLAHLAAADDDYEVFTDTAAVLRALEEEDARAGRPALVPSMRKGGWRAPGFRTALVVTGTMVLLALGLALWGRDGTASHAPLQLAMRADPDSLGLADLDPWTPRGGVRGSGRGAAGDARAVRAGAMLVDLALAVRARDTARTLEAASRLAALSPGATANAPLEQIAARPHAPADSLNALVETATERLRQRLGRKPLELGAWAEAARVAAHARNAAFFEDGASGGMLRRAERMARGDDDALAAVAQVGDALPAGGATQWDALAERLETMLSELAR